MLELIAVFVKMISDYHKRTESHFTQGDGKNLP